jgi:hypothetical protein
MTVKGHETASLFSCRKIGGPIVSWEYINRSQKHECGIGTKATQFLIWEFTNRIFFAVHGLQLQPLYILSPPFKSVLWFLSIMCKSFLQMTCWEEKNVQGAESLVCWDGMTVIWSGVAAGSWGVNRVLKMASGAIYWRVATLTLYSFTLFSFH